MAPHASLPRRSRSPGLAPAIVALVLACGGKTTATSVTPPLPPGDASVELARVASGLSGPVDLQAPPGDTTRVFLVEKTGRIRILRDGAILPRPFLDLSSQVSGGAEQGLLGLAFHPDYAGNGRFFVHYTDQNGDTRVVGFTVSADPDSANPTGVPVLYVDQPYSNHNGGQIAFGPDGRLYVALGDGGLGGDPQGNGQSLSTLLGKILRLDVDSGAPYAIPPDNPFVGVAGARAEIWSYGWRNPWRFAFDAATGDLWVADVGQDAWEEVNVEPARTGGRNYGWNAMEGDHCYPASSPCDTAGLTRPLLEYPHSEGCSITGGYVYRGRELPELDGFYFYGDFCSGMIRSVRRGPGSGTESADWTSSLRRADGGAPRQLTSFGLDAKGELYVLLLDGDVYRLGRRP